MQYFENFETQAPCAVIEDEPKVKRRGVQLCLGQFDFRPKDVWMKRIAIHTKFAITTNIRTNSTGMIKVGVF